MWSTFFLSMSLQYEFIRSASHSTKDINVTNGGNRHCIAIKLSFHFQAVIDRILHKGLNIIYIQIELNLFNIYTVNNLCVCVCEIVFVS